MEQWVQGESQFTRAAKAEFAQVADGWLAAYSQAHPDRILVTNEVHRAHAKSRVLLPTVCLQFGVPYVDTFGMLKDLRARFVL
jgi:Domain of unknown function (DUF4411)